MDLSKVKYKATLIAMYEFTYMDLQSKGKEDPELEEVLEEILKALRLSGLYKRNPYDLSTVVEIHYVFR